MKNVVQYRKSPIVIVGNFIALQFATAALYALAASLAYYAQIWRSIPYIRDIDFSIAQAIFLFFGEIGLIMYMFVAWHRQVIRVTRDQLTYDRGIIMHTRTAVALDEIATVTFRQSFLGRRTHYGRVDIMNAKGEVLVSLDSMPEPQEFVEELMQKKKNGGGVVSVDPHALVALPEHEQLERKSTLRWDLHSQSVNKNLEKAALKTVAAFMNTAGGHLMLGIGDQGEAIGLDADYASLPRRDADGFQNHFSNLVGSMMGPSYRGLVRMQPFTHQEKECMLVSVRPSDRPVYLREQEREELYIRTGNGSTSLKMSEAQSYIASHFESK